MNENPKIKVNYIYFGLFLALLIIISTNSVLVRENLSGSMAFFWLYGVGQSILEVTLFAFCAWLIESCLGRKWFWAFIGATFGLLLMHSFDFAVDRILDLSIYETFYIFVLQETPEQFYYLLEASGVPFWGWAILFGAIGAVPLIGIALYKASEYLIRNKPLLLTQGSFLILFLSIPSALFIWDFTAGKVMHPDTYASFIQTLPWKFTFLPPATIEIPLNGPLFEPMNEKQVAEQIANTPTVLANKPNIYLFIIESFREDFVTADVAPHLNQFRNENFHFKSALSNANGTMISWFSTFYSQFPYFWNKYQEKKWSMGSPALNLLKEWGYKIRVYTSAELAYYGMEDGLFRKDRSLPESIQTFRHAPPLTAADTDAAAIEKLQKDMAEDPSLQEGHVFIVFWDATHFDYKWKKNEEPKFGPVANEFAYFKAFNSKRDMEPIKNRYRNAIHFVDGLFGNFMDGLPRKEESIVVVMGDHGEEFYERGHLFHGSHLIKEQTNVPLYFKFGKGDRLPAAREVVSQMDIFPSIIDYLSQTTIPFLEGESIFRETKWPYAVISRFHAGHSPFEFCLHNGRHKIIAQFANTRDIFKSDRLYIKSICCCKDQILYECGKDIQGWVKSEFGPALQRLFIQRSLADLQAASIDERFDLYPLCGQPLCP